MQTYSCRVREVFTYRSVSLCLLNVWTKMLKDTQTKEKLPGAKKEQIQEQTTHFYILSANSADQVAPVSSQLNS